MVAIPLVTDMNAQLFRAATDMLEHRGLRLLSELTVFDKYARYVEAERRRETWDEIIDRNCAMHCRRYPGIADEIRALYRAFVFPKMVLPSMRSLQFAGKPIELVNSRLMNCLKRDTAFITRSGIHSFEDFEDGDTVTVLTHRGTWRKATVRRYGEQQLNRITFQRDTVTKTVHATPNHRWLLHDGSVTTELAVDDSLLRATDVFSSFDFDQAPTLEKLYWCYGFTYGDGNITGNHSALRLCGHKKKYLTRFTELGFSSSTPLSCKGDPLVCVGTYRKTLPDPLTDSPELIRAFIHGYLSADGSRNPRFAKNPNVSEFLGVQTSKDIDQLRHLLTVAGCHVVSEKDLTGETTNYGKRGPTTLFRLNSAIRSPWRVVDIQPSSTEHVWCLEVPNEQSFVLAGGMVTGNCAATPIDDPRAFREIMFLLLGGTGVGFSVQSAHINQLPRVIQPVSTRRYVIQDSIIGWAEAVDALFKAYLCGKPRPRFIYDDIRPRGARLKTTGGRAPGPDGLRTALENVDARLAAMPHGHQMRPIEIHDLVCFIAQSVLSGGIRRSAMISLFDFDDEEMIHAKSGQWWTDNPQRALANNSAMALRHRITRRQFDQYMADVEASGSGEPGLYFGNDANSLTNPCAEASVNQNFCNLTTFNFSVIESQQDLRDFAKAAAFLGTLQAGYTDYHYLRPVWQERTEKEALLGVSMTGIARSDFGRFDLRDAAQQVIETNQRVAGQIGINSAYRLTVNKPEGTSSAVLQTSSGVHAWHDRYFIRRTRYSADSPLVRHLRETLPDAVEADRRDPSLAVVSLPCRAPDNAITRHEPMEQLLDRIHRCSTEWVREGHRKGHNGHSVSATVSVKPDQWGQLRDWMWDHRYQYNGLSVLPYDGGTYDQAPFETISPPQYHALAQQLPDTLDLHRVTEVDDATEHSQEVACAGGACTI